MANTSGKKRVLRLKRKIHIRKKLSGTAQCPRLSVFRSLQHIYVQAIDDEKGICLAAASTLDKDVKPDAKKASGKVSRAQLVGKLLATRLQGKKISQAVFDRGGFCYTGRVAAVAASIREAGIKI